MIFGFFSKRFSAFLLVILISFSQVFSQSSNRFPTGSARGNTEMSRNVRPAQIPNLSINLTEPRTGQEMAFSVRLYLHLLLHGRKHRFFTI